MHSAQILPCMIAPAERILLGESCRGRRTPLGESCYARQLPLGQPCRARWLLSSESRRPLWRLPLYKSRHTQRFSLDESRRAHQPPLGKCCRPPTDPAGQILPRDRSRRENPATFCGERFGSHSRQPPCGAGCARSVIAPRPQNAQTQNPQSKPPRENTELISFFAQALWGLATTLSVAPHSATSPSSSTRSLSASPDTRAMS